MDTKGEISNPLPNQVGSSNTNSRRHNHEKNKDDDIKLFN